MTLAVRVTARAAAIVAIVLIAAVDARAQDAPPPVDQIIARYHDVVGADAFAAIQSLHAIGRIDIPVAGASGTFEIWQARPNRTIVRASLPGFGEVQTGYTGAEGWSLDPEDGPRLLTGEEANQARDDANFDSHLRMSAFIDSMSAAERTTISGHDCYKIRTIWKSGRVTVDCFSVQTGLLVASQRTHHSIAGATEATVIYDDYREFDGARMPTRITTHFEGVDQVVTLENITLNSVPDSVFAPPPTVRSLIGNF